MSAKQPTLDQIGSALPESAWKARPDLSSDTHRVSEAHIEGVGVIRRREFIGDEWLQRVNSHLYETSGRFSQRSAGAIGTPVANIPMSVMFNPKSGIVQKMREGDRDHLAWWLDREENRPFRTHKGRLDKGKK